MEAKTQGLGNGRDEQVRRIQGGEGDKGDAVGEKPDLSGGDLERQPRLADAPRPGQRHQAAIGIGQQVGQLGQFLFPAHERRGRRGQAIAGVMFLLPRRLPFDLLVEAGGFRRRLHPQLPVQHAPAGAILGQGRAPLAVEGQEAHQLPVRLLAPGFDLHLALRQPNRRLPIAPPLVIAGQGDQSVHHLAA